MELRARILEAAIREFARAGYHGTSTKKIALRAKVSEMTVFRTFKSKQQLAHQCLHKVLDRQPSFPVEGSPWQKLECFVLSFARHLEASPADILFIDSVGLSGIKRLTAIVVEQNHLLMAQLEQWLRQGQLEGQLRLDMDVEAAVFSLFANLLAIKELCLKFPTCNNCHELLQRLLNQIRRANTPVRNS